MKLRLTLNYNVPSLNVTRRQHWSEQMREKKKAWSALLFALSDTACDRSIPIISPEAAKIYSMAYDTLSYWLVTNRGASSFKLSKSKPKLGLKNGP